jgi:hypothetical protein
MPLAVLYRPLSMCNNIAMCGAYKSVCVVQDENVTEGHHQQERDTPV